MNKIILDINDDVVLALEKIKQVDGASLEVEIPEGSVILDNITNLKLLERKSADFNKSLHFHTTDPVGVTLISMLNSEEEDASGYLTKHVALDESNDIESISSPTSKNPLRRVHMPSIGKKPAMFFLVFLMLIGLGGAAYYFLNSNPTATVTIVVKSQPLIKSFPIKVTAGETTSATDKILRGSTKVATVNETVEIETTGEVTEGEKAKGEAKIYNKTDSEIKLKKGTEFKFDDDNKDLTFKTTSEVTVPARTDLPADPADPTVISYKAGEETVGLEAEEFGGSYNIDKGENLKVDDYDDDEMYAKTNEDFSGGSSKKVKVVAKEDIAKVKEQLTPKLLEKSEAALKAKETSSEKFIMGSAQTSIATESFSHKEGEKTEKLELTQTGESKGLFYTKVELDKLVDSLVVKFVPDGFKLSSENRDVKVEVLGQSDNSVLDAEEADLQITLRTYVVPDLEVETLKAELAGKTLKEAEKVLGSIRNIKTYGVNLEGALSLPIFQKIPSSTENIVLDIKLDD